MARALFRLIVLSSFWRWLYSTSAQIAADGSIPSHAFTEAPPVSKTPMVDLMNDLQARMKQIQATPDPYLRQRQMDDFLKTLKDGMAQKQRPEQGPQLR